MQLSTERHSSALHTPIISMYSRWTQHRMRLGSERATSMGFEVRQFFDIPPIRIKITEKRAQSKTCTCCQSRKQVAFPHSNCQPVLHGPEAQAVATYLSQYQILPYQRLTESRGDLFQLSFSQGTVNNILRREHRNLKQFDERSRALIGTSNVVHFDETGLRVGKQLHWVRVASNKSVTCYMH